MPSHLLFLGTYTRNGSKGIYSVRLDSETGALSTPVLAAETPDPSWITLSPDNKFLYAVHPSSAQAAAFATDLTTGRLLPLAASPSSPASVAAQPPCHLAVDATGHVLLSANYRDGYVSAIPIRDDGMLGPPNSIPHEGRGPHPQRQDKAHVHSVTVSPDNRFVIVADLGLDKIFTYALDPAAARLTPANPPFVATTPAAGPRHFKFGPPASSTAAPTFAYAINELANTITAYAYNAGTGALTERQTVSTLPPDFPPDATNITAEIRVHANGRFVYGSNRGHDSIAVFAIDPATGLLSVKPLQIIATGGKNPRNFALSPDGKWLVCGHQDTPLVTVFRVDPGSGQLTATEHAAQIPAVVCVHFVA